jgi:hypothetical protein
MIVSSDGCMSEAESERRICSSAMAGPVLIAFTIAEVFGIVNSLLSVALCPSVLR